MADASEITAFTMHGARDVLPAEARYIEQQVRALEQAVAENAGLAFDLARTLIESACKTIMADRGHTVDSVWELPRLLKETLGKLRLTPEGCDGAADVSASLRKTVGGLQTVIHGICELRGTHGFASHGKDAYAEQLEQVQAVLVARAADAVVGFLFRVHRQYRSTEPSRRLIYEELTDFNDWIDEQNDPVRIFALPPYRPSEVLYNVDHDAYRDLLANYEDDKSADSAASMTDEGQLNESI